MKTIQVTIQDENHQLNTDKMTDVFKKKYFGKHLIAKLDQILENKAFHQVILLFIVIESIKKLVVISKLF